MGKRTFRVSEKREGASGLGIWQYRAGRWMGECAHLAVAHILVSGKTDGGAVGEDRAVVAGTLGSESVHGGRFGDVTRIVLVLDGVLAPAVQDADEDGLFLGDHGVSCELHVSLSGCCRVVEGSETMSECYLNCTLMHTQALLFNGDVPADRAAVVALRLGSF